MKSTKEIGKWVTRRVGYTSNKKIIVIESDDWGGIRVPSAKALNDYQDMFPDALFDHYQSLDGLDSYEDACELESRLFKYEDALGHHPAFTMNFVVANPCFSQPYNESNAFEYESIKDTYARYFPGKKTTLDAVKESISSGRYCLYPQLHGREHLNATEWLAGVRQSEHLRQAYSLEMIGVDSGEYHAMDALSTLNSSVDHYVYLSEAVAEFKRLFGFEPKSFIPSCYVISDDDEAQLARLGVHVLQSGWFRKEAKGDGTYRKRLNIMGSRSKYDQVRLVRNCQFEPSQWEFNGYGVDRCVAATLSSIAKAFDCGQPAVICSHRVNYSSLICENNRSQSLDALDFLLSEIASRWPDAIFMTSDELGGVIAGENSNNIGHLSNLGASKSGRIAKMNQVEVLVIGGDHENTLGSIRAFGREGIKFSLLIHTSLPFKDMLLPHSKYYKDADHVIIVSDAFSDVRDAIQDWLANRNQSNCFLFAGSDLAQLVIDEYFGDSPAHKFGFTNDEYRVADLMNKKNQGQWLEKGGFRVPASTTISFSQDWNSVLASWEAFPCVIKPLVSAYGNKGDIAIAETWHDLKKHAMGLLEGGYESFLLQEYCDYNYEICVFGCVFSDGASAIWTGLEKESRYPEGTGSTAFGTALRAEDCIIAEKVVNYLAQCGFSGCFDIDMFVSDRHFVNEINFRQSGNIGFALDMGVNMPAIWVLSESGVKQDPQHVGFIGGEGVYVAEMRYLKHAKELDLGLSNAIQVILKSDSHALYAEDDNRVLLAAFIRAARNRAFHFCRK